MCVFWNDPHVFLSVFCSSSAVWSCLCSPPSRITRGSPIKVSSSWYDSSHVYTTASASLFILCFPLFLHYIYICLHMCWVVCSWRHRWLRKQPGGFRCCWLCRKSQMWSTNPNSYPIVSPLRPSTSALQLLKWKALDTPFLSPFHPSLFPPCSTMCCLMVGLLTLRSLCSSFGSITRPLPGHQPLVDFTYMNIC